MQPETGKLYKACRKAAKPDSPLYTYHLFLVFTIMCRFVGPHASFLPVLSSRLSFAHEHVCVCQTFGTRKVSNRNLKQGNGGGVRGVLVLNLKLLNVA